MILWVGVGARVCSGIGGVGGWLRGGGLDRKLGGNYSVGFG